jgi:hypothetical protein
VLNEAKRIVVVDNHAHIRNSPGPVTCVLFFVKVHRGKKGYVDDVAR